ncbi:unnamed protein product [Owenia fusiformis]|uniref:Uncharacterized protein n=1 Tax=Owenia fusiformis TaxID=6347 RepID=A0A8S4MUK4_OWEFU|nr:unnamed protein product [Owenia fusiformis]
MPVNFCIAKMGFLSDHKWHACYMYLLCLALIVITEAQRWENHDPWKIGEFELNVKIMIDTERSSLSDFVMEKELTQPCKETKILLVAGIRELSTREFHLNDELTEIMRMTMKDMKTFKNIKNSLQAIVHKNLDMMQPRLAWYYNHKECKQDENGDYCFTQVDYTLKFFNTYKLKGQKQMKKVTFKDYFQYRIKRNSTKAKSDSYHAKGKKHITIVIKHVFTEKSIVSSLAYNIWTFFFGKAEDIDDSIMIIIPSFESTTEHDQKVAHLWKNFDPWKIREFEITARFEVEPERSRLSGNQIEEALKQPSNEAKHHLIEDLRNLTHLEFHPNDEVTNIIKQMLKGFKTFTNIKNSLKLVVHESLNTKQPRLAWFYDRSECSKDDTGDYCMTRVNVELKLIIPNKKQNVKQKEMTFEKSFIYGITATPSEASDLSDRVRKPLFVKIRHSTEMSMIVLQPL